MEAFRALLQQATSSGSRSTVLQPLIWFIGIVTVGLMLGGFYSTPWWILSILAAAWVVAVGIFLGFYVYFAGKDPDLLRSERFTLSKMALEKNLIGDSTQGLIEVDEIQQMKIITTPPSNKQLEGRDA